MPKAEGAEASVVAAVRRAVVAMESFMILPSIVVVVVVVAAVIPNFSFELLFMGRRDLLVNFFERDR
jgi:amino acid permease